MKTISGPINQKINFKFRIKVILCLTFILGTLSLNAFGDTNNNFNKGISDRSEINQNEEYIHFGETESKGQLYCNGKVNMPNGDSSNVGCFYKNMPLYNQRVVSEMHCIPTSAAMSLDTLVTEGINYSNYFNITRSVNWLSTTYLPQSTISDKIQTMGNLMSTSSTSGTSGPGASFYPGLAQFFKNASNINLSASIIKFTNTYFAERVLSGESGFMVYGHYAESCATIGTKTTCTYTRNNGHAVVVNGFYGISSTIALNIFNPYGTDLVDPNAGVEESRSIEYLINSSSTDYRPYGNNTYYLFKNGSQVKIIDSWRSIDTN